MNKYTLFLDENNYVLSIAHTQNDNIELDLSQYDLSHISCYRFVNSTLILDEVKYNEQKLKEKREEIKEEIATLKQELAKTDYQAIKYSEGWFTDEEYVPIKAQRESLREHIRELEKQLKI